MFLSLLMSLINGPILDTYLLISSFINYGSLDDEIMFLSSKTHEIFMDWKKPTVSKVRK